jgi:hypothetical protein
MLLFFPRLWLDHLPPHRLDQLSTLPHPHQAGVKAHGLPPALSRRCAICLQAGLVYVPFSRACSPGMVALSLSGIGSQQPCHTQAGAACQRFCIHESWWLLYSTNIFRTHFAVVCVEILLLWREEKGKQLPIQKKT